MTITVKSEIVSAPNDYHQYYISIEYDTYSSGYNVSISPYWEDEVIGYYVGYPLNELYYGTIEKAKRRFNYLRRKVQKGEF